MREEERLAVGRLLGEHDGRRWGPARAAVDGRPKLLRVIKLIAAMELADELALPVAAARVIERLGAAALFMLDPAGDASRVTAADRFSKVWPAGSNPVTVLRSFWEMPEPEPDPSQFFFGESGLRLWMRKHWVEGWDTNRFDANGWDDDEGARAAVLESEAMALFPELFGLAEFGSVGEPAEASRPASAEQQVIQPEGGQWPHVEGQAWTDAERAALFLMRHRDKRTGEDLATVAGVKRQRIDELIGGARPHGGPSAARGADGWAPSAELLAACGQPLQPLQTAALAMAS